MIITACRDLMLSPIAYMLCTSPSHLKAALKKLEAPHDVLGQGVNEGFGATTHFLTRKDEGDEVAIVCLYDHSHSLEQTYSLLFHEATHIWQAIKDAINEKKPSPEFEAYAVQTIGQYLVTEYNRQLKIKLPVRKKKK